MSNILFRDRAEAGAQLAEAVLHAKETAIANGIWTSPIVYGLPKGGVPLAEVVAQILGCPLDIVVAKKITAPQSPEFAIGAVTADGQVVYPSRRSTTDIQSDQWQDARCQAQAKAQAQEQQWSTARAQANPTEKIAILVDDGIATGMTMAAAVQAIRVQQPRQIWICAPVAPAAVVQSLQTWCDRIIILEQPHPFQSVSRFYDQFPQVSPEEVEVCLLHQHHRLSVGHH